MAGGFGVVDAVVDDEFLGGGLLGMESEAEGEGVAEVEVVG